MHGTPLSSLVEQLEPAAFGHALFDLHTEQLRQFDDAFLSSLNLSWSRALQLPTWRDIARHQCVSCGQEALLEQTLLAISTAHESIRSGSSHECSVLIPLVKERGATQVRSVMGNNTQSNIRTVVQRIL